MPKGIVTYLFAIAVGIGIFAGGFYSGAYVLGAIKSTTLLQDSFFMYTEVEDPLQYLDEGDVKSARERLKTKSDIAVLQIDAFSKHADEKSSVTACNILRNIANHRASHENLYPEVSETDKYVAEILAKWKNKEC
jgi:hypothetical protein